MSDLLYSVGVDPTTLETGVSAIEARLAESGVIMAEVPAKFAKASADAFNQVYAAEDKLAAYRKQVAFERMSDEEKIAVLRAEALGLFEQIQVTEERSVERASLQLQYEQKKTAIYELNQELIAAQNVALAEQTAEQGVNVGLMEKLNGWGKEVKEVFHEMGVRLHGAGIGLIIAEVISLTREEVKEAQKLRDEYEKTGKTLDYETMSMAKLGDAIGPVKAGLTWLITAPVKGMAELAQVTGSFINRLRGISEAEENNREASARAADAAEAHLKKLKEEQHDLEKIAVARKALMELETQSALSSGTDDEKLTKLIVRNLELREQLENTEKNTVLYYEREKLLLENNNELQKLGVDYVKRHAEIEMEAIKNVAPLNVTYREKVASLLQQQSVLEGELEDLAKGSTEYEKVSNQLKQIGVSLLQMQREWRQKAALDQAAEIEIARLQLKGIGNLTDAEHARYDVLVLQKKEKEFQYQIEELMQKKIEAGLTPAENERLKSLFKQSDNLGEQIKLKQALTSATAALVPAVDKEKSAEDKVTEELEKQLALLGRIGKVKDGKILVEGGVLGLHNLGGISSDTLEAEQKQMQDQLDAIIRDYQQKGYNRDAKLDNYNLVSQINSIKEELSFRADFQSAFARGGRAGALQDYIASGRDALSFDTALANMASWSQGQAITNQQLGSLNKALTGISTQLAQSPLFPKPPI